MDEQDDVVATVAVDTRGYEGSGVPVDLRRLPENNIPECAGFSFFYME
jgi:hypothetical protein